jgi:hypothetical protein
MPLAFNAQLASANGNGATFTLTQPTVPALVDLYEIYVIWRDNTVTLDTAKEGTTDIPVYQNERGTVMGGLAVFYVLSPAAGSHSYVITFSGATDYYAAIRAYSGARQTSPPFQGWVKTEGNSNAPAGTIVASNICEIAVDVVAVDIQISPAPTATVGAGQSQDANDLQGDLRALASRKAGSAAPSLSWALSGATDWLDAVYTVLHAYKGSTADIVIPFSVAASGATRQVGLGFNQKANFTDTVDQEVSF